MGGRPLTSCNTVGVSTPSPEAAGARRSGAETARKVLRVLLHFSPRRPTATVRELADDSSLPLPTAHRYVALLKELGLVEEAGRGSYQLGWRALQLGQAASMTGGLLQVAEPVMHRLAGDTDETVILFRMSGDEMECVGQVESQQVVRLSYDTGHRLPLSAGASARSLLSGVDAAALPRVLDRLAAGDPAFAARRDAFARDIESVRHSGWAVSREEIDRGIWAVAGPIRVGGQVVASLAVAGPVHRYEAAMQEPFGRLVRAAADDVGATLSRRS